MADKGISYNIDKFEYNTNLTKKEIHQLFEFCMDNDYNELLDISNALTCSFFSLFKS